MTIIINQHGKDRKKAIFVRRFTLVLALAVLVVALVPAAAFAASYDEPVAGESPHAGWTTTSDQCKQCHAVHLATGNRLLLRSMDSRYNDCAYCHLDGTGGAGFDVYIGNLNNGHTMAGWVSKEATGGARPSRYNANGTVNIPDNSVSFTSDARNYRGGSRSVGTHDAYVGLDTEVEVSPGSGLRDNGDTSFNCNACHMAHANPSKLITWRFESYNPNARTRNTTGLYTYYGPDYARYKNFDGSYSDQNSRIVNTSTLTNKILVRNPNDRSDGAAATYYSYVDASARTSGDRSLALTQWCADCHNQNVKGPGMLNGAVVPNYASAYTEQADIFSHSTAYNLSGQSKYMGYTTSQGGAGYTGIAPSCADCHVGYSDSTAGLDVGNSDPRVTGNYGDWPHSGADSSYALLNPLYVRSAASEGATSTTLLDNQGTDATTYDAVGLDGLCRSCHGGAGTSSGRDPQDTIMPNTSVPGTFEANPQ